jgi:sulfite reductase (NADPH) hemoprotein beta-component
VAGKIVGPSFAATEVADVVEAILEVYREQREAGETFIQSLRRLGHEPFKLAANAARQATARAEA